MSWNFKESFISQKSIFLPFYQFQSLIAPLSGDLWSLSKFCFHFVEIWRYFNTKSVTLFEFRYFSVFDKKCSINSPDPIFLFLEFVLRMTGHIFGNNFLRQHNFFYFLSHFITLFTLPWLPDFIWCSFGNMAVSYLKQKQLSLIIIFRCWINKKIAEKKYFFCDEV